MHHRIMRLLRGDDVAKAHQYLCKQSDVVYREATQSYDAFVPRMAKVKEPAFRIGTALDSLGNEVVVRYPVNEDTLWLIKGTTGSGKSSKVADFIVQGLRNGWPVGALDFKADFLRPLRRLGWRHCLRSCCGSTASLY